MVVTGLSANEVRVVWNGVAGILIAIILFVFARRLAVLNVKAATYYPEWARGEKAIKILTAFIRVGAVLIISSALWVISLTLKIVH